MEALSDEILPLEQKLALAHATGPFKERLRAFLHLDHRLGQFVSRASEPLVTQLRLAWWRDQLGKKPEERSNGDPILDTLSQLWVGEDISLINLVNGWEGLLAEPPLPDELAINLCQARGACFATLTGQDSAAQIGEVWSLADLVVRANDRGEKDHLVSLTSQLAANKIKLPFRFRALTILGSLGFRSLAKGGKPLLDTRRDFLHVAKLGLLGR